MKHSKDQGSGLPVALQVPCVQLSEILHRTIVHQVKTGDPEEWEGSKTGEE